MDTRRGNKRKAQNALTQTRSCKQRLAFESSDSEINSEQDKVTSDECVEDIGLDEDSQFDEDERRFIQENTNQNARSNEINKQGKDGEQINQRSKSKQGHQRKQKARDIEESDDEIQLNETVNARPSTSSASEQDIDKLNSVVHNSNLSASDISRLSDLFQNKDSIDKILSLADRLNEENFQHQAEKVQDPNEGNAGEKPVTIADHNEIQHKNDQATGVWNDNRQLVKDKAVQSPSETTIYSRMCPSLTDAGSLVTNPVPTNGSLEIEKLGADQNKHDLIYSNGPVTEKSIDSFISDIRRSVTQIDPDKTADQLEKEKQLLAERESKERADKILLEAELNRAELLKPGNDSKLISEQELIAEKLGELLGVNLKHLVYDAQHKSLGSHVDAAMRSRILRGEYVELEKLLPKHLKGNSQNQKRMHLVNTEGRALWAPENEGPEINSYRKWEQAFEVYASIYITGFPKRAGELYDYKYVIRDAADNFIWENVAGYDEEFRRHLGSHPSRGWTPKLSDEWTKHMKTQLHKHGEKGGAASTSGGHSSFANQNVNNNGGAGQKAREICRRYNKGRCTFGKACKFLHRCSICNKYGHGASICRRKDNSNKDSKSREDAKRV